jgi:plasmid maintenance system antidote protein VapI
MGDIPISDRRRQSVSSGNNYFPSGRRSDGCIRIYPNGDAGMKYVLRSQWPLTLEVIRLSRGIEARVARKLGVHHNSVSKVVRGLLKSARISSAIAAEIAIINQQIISTPTPKPRITLRLSKEEGGTVFATHPFLNGDIFIARRNQDTINKVAARLGVTRQTVRNVLKGRWRSKRVASALIAAGFVLSPPEQPRFNPGWGVLSGKYAAIARNLGVSAFAVCKVASGISYSARISAALDRELREMEAAS